MHAAGLMPSIPTTRRSVVAMCIFAFCAILARPAAAAQPAPNPRDLLPAGLEIAIDRGLFFLQKQQKADGSFDAIGPANANTGLALLAFLASGHTPDAGKYGLTVRAALDYLASQKPEGGYFGRDDGRMYSHCIVTLALAEAHGTETDELQRRRVRATLDKCLAVLLAAQDVRKDKGSEGGWRYEPTSSDSDLSVTAWCTLALRACQNAGLNVPPERFERATTYMLSCYRPQTKVFAYQPGGDGSIAMTAAALLNLHLAGAGRSPEAEGAASLLMQKPPKDGERYHYYTLYYVTEAAFQAGDKAWPILWKNTCDQLLASQRKDDGSWPAKPNEPGGDHKPGRFYATAMASLTLSVPLGLLPVYQR